MPNNQESKPARLAKLEAAYEDRVVAVMFEEMDAGYWSVYLDGYFADHELAEIAKALRAVNKAGRL